MKTGFRPRRLTESQIKTPTMKFSQVVFLACQTVMVLAFTPSAADVAECGELGVLTYNVSDLPAGVSPDSVRKCANHPLGKITPEIAARDGAPATNILGKRDCWYGASYGCSGDAGKPKYCWKTCGANGEWCWTAQGGGWGPWIGCNTAEDCNQGMACGLGNGDCTACGCSCNHT
ncbi:hypothetical protein L218DRAFT_394915 [Marasmius fiardii PR-910]|nr:hypothetical protein L218DRAFT_394915 [Marasmius fiardii PR-910]